MKVFTIRKLQRIISLAAVALTFIVAQPVNATAAEIRVWTSRAIATVLALVDTDFERTTGHKLIIISDLPTGFAKRAGAGQQFDVFISGSTPVDEWIRAGKIMPETRTYIARSGIGVAVRAGMHKPDLSSVEAFKRTLLEAKSIAHLNVGSGLYLEGLFKRLGIADALEKKITRQDSDIVCELVARGVVELGIVVTTQILTSSGVEFAGPLPPEIQSHIMFTAGVSKNSKAPDAARQLIKFLTSETVLPAIESQGMDAAAHITSGVSLGEKCENRIVVTIERESCFGGCPIYSAQIYADGTVVYTGKRYVKEIGERRYWIPQRRILALINEFERIDYFSLKYKYDADENGQSVTDLPTTTTSICHGGRTKRVVNYYAAPKKLHELEDKIDGLAGLYQFIGPL